MPVVNINSDIGESFGPWKMGDDAGVMPLINSANIACGFHGGDPDVMLKTVQIAMSHGVTLGAHPGFHDLQGFGRRQIKMSARELENMCAYQIGALMGVAAIAGGKVTHVKAHGALGNLTAVDIDAARALVRAIKAIDPKLIHVGLANSCLAKATIEAGIPLASEGFMDRMYDDDGNLTSRANADAVHHDPAVAVKQVLAMVQEKVIVTRSGKRIPAEIHTLCVHGDEPTARALGAAVKQALLDAGVQLKTLPEMAL